MNRDHMMGFIQPNEDSHPHGWGTKWAFGMPTNRPDSDWLTPAEMKQEAAWKAERDFERGDHTPEHMRPPKSPVKNVRIFSNPSAGVGEWYFQALQQMVENSSKDSFFAKYLVDPASLPKDDVVDASLEPSVIGVDLAYYSGAKWSDEEVAAMAQNTGVTIASGMITANTINAESPKITGTLQFGASPVRQLNLTDLSISGATISCGSSSSFANSSRIDALMAQVQRAEEAIKRLTSIPAVAMNEQKRTEGSPLGQLHFQRAEEAIKNLGALHYQPT